MASGDYASQSLSSSADNPCFRVQAGMLWGILGKRKQDGQLAEIDSLIAENTSLTARLADAQQAADYWKKRNMPSGAHFHSSGTGVDTVRTLRFSPTAREEANICLSYFSWYRWSCASRSSLVYMARYRSSVIRTHTLWSFDLGTAESTFLAMLLCVLCADRLWKQEQNRGRILLR